jgi:hypothetical protein
MRAAWVSRATWRLASRKSRVTIPLAGVALKLLDLVAICNGQPRPGWTDHRLRSILDSPHVYYGDGSAGTPDHHDHRYFSIANAFLAKDGNR